MQDFPFPIITYQVITGNYNSPVFKESENDIITYRVITGNYNYNYNYNVLWESSDNIFKKYKWKKH